MSIIECRDLTKNYGKIKALNKLSFYTEENTITGLVGFNYQEGLKDL